MRGAIYIFTDFCYFYEFCVCLQCHLIRNNTTNSATHAIARNKLQPYSSDRFNKWNFLISKEISHLSFLKNIRNSTSSYKNTTSTCLTDNSNKENENKNKKNNKLFYIIKIIIVITVIV